MNRKDDIFKRIYLDIVNEGVEVPVNNKKEVTSPDPEKVPDTGNAPIDDLTKENTATIDEDSTDPTDNQEEVNKNKELNLEVDVQNEEEDEENDDREDGWGDELVEKLTYLLEDLDNFTYEIRNCVKGAYTGCKTKEQLADYMINTLAENLKIEAEDLYNE